MPPDMRSVLSFRVLNNKIHRISIKRELDSSFGSVLKSANARRIVSPTTPLGGLAATE